MYKKLLGGGILPVPLTDRSDKQGLLADVEVLPASDLVAILPVADAPGDVVEEDDELRELIAH